ncbi:MAG: hypothetical protein ACFCU4_05530 [Puniceicoccaceae bacterium]
MEEVKSEEWGGDQGGTFLGERGFLYVATETWFVEEAARSWETVQRFHPDLEAVLVTDVVPVGQRYFKKVVSIEKAFHNPLDKIEPLTRPPFVRTVFLDTDTLIFQSLEPLFDSLENYELLVAPDPWAHPEEGAPELMRQYNTGVLAYRGDSEAVRQFFRAWAVDYQEMVALDGGYTNDQRSFLRLLGKSELRWFTLDPAFNFRTNAPGILRSHLQLAVLHGRIEGDPYELKEKMSHPLNGFSIYIPSLLSLGQARVVLPSRFWSRMVWLVLFPVRLYAKVVIGRLARKRRRRKEKLQKDTEGQVRPGS